MKPLLPAYATSAALSVQCTYIIALQIAVDTLTPSRADRYRPIHASHCLQYVCVSLACGFFAKINYVKNTRYTASTATTSAASVAAASGASCRGCQSHAAGLCSHHRRRRRQHTSSWPTVLSPAISSLKPATRNKASICAGSCFAATGR